MNHLSKAKKTLYIPIEIKSRELESKLLFAYYATKQNYRVIIGEQLAVEKSLSSFAQGIFFSKGYPHSHRKRIISKAKKLGHEIVEMDEEGLIFHNSIDYLKTRMKEDVLKMVSQEFCWGDYQRDLIRAAYPRISSKCTSTGSLRFDLLKPKFRSLYEDETGRLRKKYGEFILINTRFTLYNHINGKKKAEKGSHTDYIRQLYVHFIEMIKKLRKTYPQFKLVIRPHPAEDFQSYRRAFSTDPNVHIIHEGNVIHWILASKLVIHNGCTTGIEASILDKPVISFKPVQSKLYDVALPNEVSLQAFDFQEVCGHIQSILNLQPNVKRTEHLARYYHENGYAYENILELLARCKVTAKPFSTSIVSDVKSKHIKYRFPYFREEEIKRFFYKIDEVEGNKNRVSIRKLSDRLFVIESVK
ncbi:hypothetical protein LF817_01240 [Halobacillus sp. A1]|uniref:surface carbohydrate biosynthesis protein n=1 Tax=Halobacillus sp. A1 TaxID=2880262 RepID=UPI0020A65532|nr:surface carbohydrate biosynthesis protein [Halobacillus sp. A1]MCP3029956.1 hypothetical protein [Halobacillus sp. A1]